MAFGAPAVSIVLPTFNRADVIGRAIDSVLAQRFGDFELIVVDDGSTDGTAERVAGLDPRIVVVRQENAGVYVARNRGLSAARGRWITFLDSDDAWEPHFLELTAGFLAAHPDRDFVTTEFLEDWGTGPTVRHDAFEIGTKYPALAERIGSRLFAMPPGETDPYLRAYASRAEIGAWGRDAASRAGARDAYVYEGSIFPHMRFGYLNWLPVTVLTRRALEAVGPFVTHARSAADYRFLGLLARSFRASMIGIPSATKHDRAPAARSLAQAHLATGLGGYRFSVNFLSFFDELFGTPMAGDDDIEQLRRYHALAAGRAALRSGLRREASAHLREAAAGEHGFWWGWVGAAFAGVAPSDRAAAMGFQVGERAFDLGRRLASGDLTPTRAAQKLLGRLFSRA